MSHFAQLDKNNVVIQVLTGNNDDPDRGYQWIIDNLGGTWVQTSYNTHGGVHYGQDGEPDGGVALYKNYAGIGYGFDGIGFFAPQPDPTWVLDPETYYWQPPTPQPESGA